MTVEGFEQGAGRDGVPAVRPVPRTPHRHRAPSTTTEVTVVTAPSLVDGWESAYRAYGLASDNLGRVGDSDPGALWRMSRTSGAVAVAWRRIAGSSQLPWWMLAAVESAAQAFEAQARDWAMRGNAALPPCGGGS